MVREGAEDSGQPVGGSPKLPVVPDLHNVALLQVGGDLAPLGECHPQLKILRIPFLPPTVDEVGGLLDLLPELLRGGEVTEVYAGGVIHPKFGHSAMEKICWGDGVEVIFRPGTNANRPVVEKLSNLGEDYLNLDEVEGLVGRLVYRRAGVSW